MRGIAALVIVWMHLRQVLFFPTWPPNAALSVDFFFCLSGFVIAHAYEDRLKSGMGFWSFAGRRLLRLAPAAVLGVLLGGGALLLHAVLSHDAAAPQTAAATALNVLMLPAFGLIRDNPQVFPTDGPLWSLFWELFINAGFALAALRLTTPRLVALVLVGAVLTVWTALSQADRLDVGARQSTFLLGFCRVLFPFACGVLVRRWLVRPRRRAPAQAPVLAPLLAPVLAAILAALLLGPDFGAIGQALAVLVGFPLLVWLGAGAQVGPWAGSACVWLGRLSYPLYAVHHPLLRVLATATRRMGVDTPALAVVLALAVTIAGGWIAMRTDETARAWLKIRMARPAPAPTPKPASEPAPAA